MKILVWSSCSNGPEGAIIVGPNGTVKAVKVPSIASIACPFSLEGECGPRDVMTLDSNVTVDSSELPSVASVARSFSLEVEDEQRARVCPFRGCSQLRH